VRLKARVISRVKGDVEGEAIVTGKKFSFLGDVDPDTGVVVANDSDIIGESIAGKIFVFPSGRGSTVGTYVLLRMKKAGTAPKAIINLETEPIIAVGAIISGISLLDKPEIDGEVVNPTEIIKSGDFVKIGNGWIEVHDRRNQE
jgi:predicted aconitase with swiveling domain